MAIRPPRPRTIIAVALVVVLIVVLAGAALARQRIQARDTRFDPRRVRVDRRERVVWKNTGSLTHTVTAYGGGWSKNVTLSPGETTSFRTGQTGRYRYRCMIHSTLSGGQCDGMCGRIRVG